MNAVEPQSFAEVLQACSTERDWFDVAPTMAEFGYEYREGSWYLLEPARPPMSSGDRWSVVIEILCGLAALAWWFIGIDVARAMDHALGATPNDQTGELVGVLVFVGLIYGGVLAHAWRGENRQMERRASAARLPDPELPVDPTGDY